MFTEVLYQRTVQINVWFSSFTSSVYEKEILIFPLLQEFAINLSDTQQSAATGSQKCPIQESGI